MYHMSGKRPVGLLLSTTVVALAAMSATASAAQTLCIGPPGGTVTVANADGSCALPLAIAKTLVEQSQLDAANARIAALETKVGALKSELGSLDTEVGSLKTKLSKVSYNASGLNGKPTLQISGANLQLVDGSGTTDGTVNGLGNLFIGYDEDGREQTGSHNLVLGIRQAFTSYGGLLAGAQNTISGAFASVSGGIGNVATGELSSISGGETNASSGLVSSVSGGELNKASGSGSSVSGGRLNIASGPGASVSGGHMNTSSARWSSVSGGGNNTATLESRFGFAASVSGGLNNTASGHMASILGGQNRVVDWSFGTSP